MLICILVFRKEEYEIEGQQYVDLELFLLGIQCPDCLPLLKKNHVTLEILITMREQDLQQVSFYPSAGEGCSWSIIVSAMASILIVLLLVMQCFVCR